MSRKNKLSKEEEEVLYIKATGKAIPDQKEVVKRALEKPAATRTERWLNRQKKNRRYRVSLGLKNFVKYKYGKEYVVVWAEKIDQYLDEIKEREKIAKTQLGTDVHFDQISDFYADMIGYAEWLSEQPQSTTSLCSYFESTKYFFAEMGHNLTPSEWRTIKEDFLPRPETAVEDRILTGGQIGKVILAIEDLQKTKLRPGRKIRTSWQTEWARSYYLGLTCTGMRPEHLLLTEVVDLRLDDKTYNLPWINLRRLKQLLGKRRGKGIPNYAFITPECADAIWKWLKVRETIKPHGRKCSRIKSFGGPKIWNLLPGLIGYVWAQGLKDTGLGLRETVTMLRVHLHHVYTLRKFFRTNLRKPTFIDPNWMPRDVVEGMMGHSVGLDSSYVRMTQKEIATIYRKHMPNLMIFTITAEMRDLEIKTINHEIERLQKRKQDLQSLDVTDS